MYVLDMLCVYKGIEVFSVAGYGILHGCEFIV